MKSLVVYESLHGNTETVARAIAEALPGDVTLRPVGEVRASEVSAYELLIIGAPTHGGQPSDGVKTLLAELPPLMGVRVAAFDTRMPWRWLRLFGFAAPKIAHALEQYGGKAVVAPEGFVVTGGEGPLKVGEETRAAAWARAIAEQLVIPEPSAP